MTKRRKILIVAVILIIGTAGIFKAGMIVGAANNAEPGSVGDPLITKSYLDSYIQNLGLSSGSGATTEGYKKVFLSKGSTLVGKEGTEILLFSGSANAYAKGEKIVNISKGEAYEDGMTLGKYCVYMCPDSSSGITAISDVVLFVKGKYTSN